jgi:hypothetical protein
MGQVMGRLDQLMDRLLVRFFGSEAVEVVVKS